MVGYNTGTTVADNNFVTVPFTDIGYNTADIQQIKISDGGQGMIGWGGEMFAIWEGAPTVVVGSGFFYNDPSMDMTGTETDYYWGDASGEKATFSIPAGQGVVISCAADLDVTTVGEVPTNQVGFTTIQDNNFTGNPFSAPIDIQSIKISDGGQGTIGWGGEMFALWQGAPSVVVGSGFFYNDPSMDMTGTETDYYWGDASGEKATFSIPAGQGVVISCAADLEITIDAPYTL
ncbi:MAG: hypothetical protein J6Z49_07100 [Kiritimatiellae bacterium]|nr:hypothetical protein [Kiritimatiellia bacterium]